MGNWVGLCAALAQSDVGRHCFSSVVADLHSGTRECNAGHYKNRPHSPLRHATSGTMNTKTFHSQSLEYFKVNQI